MPRVFIVTPFLALAAAGPLSAQNTVALDGIARAMGGRDRVAAVRTLVLDGTGDNYNLGQNVTPDAPLPRFEVTQYRRSVDVAGRRWQLDQTRVPRFVTGNVSPQRQRQGVDGDVAYNVGNDGAMQRAFGRAGVDRASEFLHHPIALMQAAWTPGASITEDQPRGGQRVVRVGLAVGQFEMRVDPVSGLPASIRHTTYHAMLGDVPLETELSDWREVDGLKLPMRLTQRIADRWVLSDLRLSSARVNADVGDLAASAELRAAPAPSPASAPPAVTVEELAPGVWYLTGQSHHSVAIEQSRSIVLVEAPQNDGRTLAVIETARGLRPGKPVDVVINTHHHFDHSGGVRAAIAQGLTVLTHEGNRDLYERTVFPGRHTIVKDALAQNPRPLRLMALGDSYIRRDSLRTIETYHLAGNPHSGTMLVVYLPAERLLIQADIFTPPPPSPTTPPAFPFLANLLEHIQRRGLAVDRVVGIHGRAVPLADLQAAARMP